MDSALNETFNQSFTDFCEYFIHEDPQVVLKQFASQLGLTTYFIITLSNSNGMEKNYDYYLNLDGTYNSVLPRPYINCTGETSYRIRIIGKYTNGTFKEVITSNYLKIISYNDSTVDWDNIHKAACRIIMQEIYRNDNGNMTRMKNIYHIYLCRKYMDILCQLFTKNNQILRDYNLIRCIAAFMK